MYIFINGRGWLARTDAGVLTTVLDWSVALRFNSQWEMQAMADELFNKGEIPFGWSAHTVVTT